MGYSFRAADLNDQKALTELLSDYDFHITGEVETTETDVKNILQAIGDLKERSWVVTNGNKIVGFACITGSEKEHPSLVVVHPNEQNKGIEKTLINRMSETLTSGKLIVSGNNEYENRIFEESGFNPVRYWFNMHINLQETKQTNEVTSDFRMESYIRGEDDVALHQAFEESFQTHFGYQPKTLDQFLERTQREGFDPSIWWKLMEGDSIAGFIMCRRSTPCSAEITHLGIRPQWRKQGLGKVLLHYAFSKLAEEGRYHIQLNVDSANGTGAVNLYERVGMSVARQFVRYDKVISKQA